MSIKVKLTILFVILSGIPLVFYGLLSISNFDQVLRERMVERFRMANDFYNNSLSEYVHHSRERLNQVLGMDGLDSIYQLDADDANRKKQLVLSQLQAFQADLPPTSQIYLLDPKGEILLTTEENLTSSQFFKPIIAADSLNRENLIYLTPNQGQQLVLISYLPIRFGNQTVGSIIIQQPIVEFQEIFSRRLGLGESGEVLLISDNLEDGGQGYVFSSTTRKTGSLISTEFLDQAIITEEPQILNYDDRQFLVIGNAIANSDLSLLIRADQAEVLAPVKVLSRSLVSLLVISLGLVSTLAFLSAQNLTAPIQKLVLFTQSVAQKKSLGQVEIESNDEFGVLGESFNNMSAQLTDFYKNLEQKVSDRTRALEQSEKAMERLMEDVSAEKEYSQAQAHELLKYKQAVEAASDQIVITDHDGIVLYANQVMEKLTGFTRQEAIGKKVGSLWGGRMDRDYFVRMWDTIKNKKQVFEDEIVNRRKNGEEYVAQIKISPVLGQQGEVLFFVGIERDITREKEIDRAKTEFVSLASHQLRTPLSIIRWYIDSLIQGKGGATKPEGKTLEYLHAIEESNVRMINLVGALLNVSRLELGTFSVTPEPVNIANLVQSVLDEYKPLIEEKHLALKIDLAPDLPTMMLDKNLALIIIENLLSNAVKYTQVGGEIKISAHVNGQWLVGEVSDTGYGIPTEAQAKVFTKLFRADNVKKKDVVGTGLGLYLVKSIIDQVGGKISFDSKLDHGTTFKIELPLSGMKAKSGTKKLEWIEEESILK